MRVTLLSGFLGSGKTTLLTHILRHNAALQPSSSRLRIALLLNDMGSINLDADLIKHSKVVQQEERMEVVELHDGCICCTLRGDLLDAVRKLGESGEYDYLIIESTGIGEPLPVAQTFAMDVDGEDNNGEEKDGNQEENGNDAVHDKESEDDPPQKKRKLTIAAKDRRSLSHYARLDTLVTVVDALNIYDVLGSIETLADDNNVSGMLGNTGAQTAEVTEVTGESARRESNADWFNGAEPETKVVTDESADSLGDQNDNDEEDEALVCPIGQDEEEEAPEIDDRPISQLWLDQIEFANVVVVSKAAMLLKNDPTGGKAKLSEIEGLLRKLNPKARVLVPQQSKFADLDPSRHLVGTGLFDMEEAQASAGWQQELEKEDGHTPETEEYGVSSNTFRSDKMPFHPERLSEILKGFGDYATALSRSSTDNKEANKNNEDVFRGVVRTKGQLWLANANAFPIDIHSAGKHLNIGLSEDDDMPFLAAIPKKDWEDEEKEIHRSLVKEGKWSEPYGDRRSELVFIGVGMDKKLIQEKLSAALLTEDESAKLGGMKGWRNLSDPFFDGNAADHFELLPPSIC